MNYERLDQLKNAGFPFREVEASGGLLNLFRDAAKDGYASTNGLVVFKSENAPKFDGHTSDDVLERLKFL